MALVTLIGEKIAKKDNTFTYLGPINECRNCKLKNVCFNLKPGRSYQITNLRDKKHNCKVHEGTAVVVEVQELPIITTVDSKFSAGSKIKIEQKNCINIGCNYYEICNVKIQKDKEYKISKILEKVECPKKLNLQKVELSE